MRTLEILFIRANMVSLILCHPSR